MCIYGNPPTHELPTLVLYRKYRVKPAFPAGPDSVSLELSKTTENKLRFQENVSVNSFKFDVRSGSCLSRTTEINLTFQQDVSVNSFRFDVST